MTEEKAQKAVDRALCKAMQADEARYCQSEHGVYFSVERKDILDVQVEAWCRYWRSVERLHAIEGVIQ